MHQTRSRITHEALERRDLFAGLAELRNVDDLYSAIERADIRYDLNEDGKIDVDDASFFVEDIIGSRLGDSDLDGRVDFQDFLNLAENYGNVDAAFADGDTNGDGQVSFPDFLRVAADFGFVAGVRILSFADGSLRIPSRKTFEALAHIDDVPGAAGIREVKFMVDLNANEVSLLNQNRYFLHYDFARNALGYKGNPIEFNQETYFTDNRRFIAGSVLAHDSLEKDGQVGGYTVEFWPTDPVKAQHVISTMELIRRAIPFADDRLYYHPAGETQRQLFDREIAVFTAANIPSITTEELFGNQTFAALNEGLAFGRLRVVDGSDGIPLSLRDLVIFENIPNDLTHVAGVITLVPQTPLSHVNLRAKQNDTPNAYIKNALNDQNIQDLIGKNVRFQIIGDTYTLREATPEEVEEHFASIRPTDVQVPIRDLTQRAIIPLAELRTADQSAYGAKAANLGELAQILPDEQVPDGLAIPFAMYHDFMTENGFYEEAESMLDDSDFKTNAVVRDNRLNEFRDKIQDGTVSAAMSVQLETAYTILKSQFGADQPFRARSSTNNEDLEGFTGAGLYRSYTHRPDEGRLENTIKQVWSSLWTFRAFEEREFWRIDHLTAAMGVAIHANFDFEQVNGVAVTKNIYDPNWTGFYVNAQVGEDLVTNPEGGAIPEEFLISAIGPRLEWETQYIRYSNLTENGAHVLSPPHVVELRIAMQAIQFHFQRVYNALGDRQFAMDIEFKVDANGQLVVKQARPWVD